VVDTSLRTIDDVAYACRSLRQYKGKPGRFYGGITYFHEGLTIGDRITWDGVPVEVARTPAGNMKDDLMTVFAQEVYRRGGNG
jgi:hypothetical protein